MCGAMRCCVWCESERAAGQRPWAPVVFLTEQDNYWSAIVSLLA
jgi:hypothetical protein